MFSEANLGKTNSLFILRPIMKFWTKAFFTLLKKTWKLQNNGLQCPKLVSPILIYLLFIIFQFFPPFLPRIICCLVVCFYSACIHVWLSFSLCLHCMLSYASSSLSLCLFVYLFFVKSFKFWFIHLIVLFVYFLFIHIYFHTFVR